MVNFNNIILSYTLKMSMFSPYDHVAKSYRFCFFFFTDSRKHWYYYSFVNISYLVLQCLKFSSNLPKQFLWDVYLGIWPHGSSIKTESSGFEFLTAPFERRGGSLTIYCTWEKLVNSVWRAARLLIARSPNVPDRYDHRSRRWGTVLMIAYQLAAAGRSSGKWRFPPGN